MALKDDLLRYLEEKDTMELSIITDSLEETNVIEGWGEFKIYLKNSWIYTSEDQPLNLGSDLADKFEEMLIEIAESEANDTELVDCFIQYVKILQKAASEEGLTSEENNIFACIIDGTNLLLASTKFSELVYAIDHGDPFFAFSRQDLISIMDYIQRELESPNRRDITISTGSSASNEVIAEGLHPIIAEIITDRSAGAASVVAASAQATDSDIASADTDSENESDDENQTPTAEVSASSTPSNQPETPEGSLLEIRPFKRNRAE